MAGPRHRIVLIKLRGIGDLVLATPAIRALRTAYPDSFLAAVTPRGSGEVLLGNPNLNEIRFYRNASSFPSMLAWFRRRRFDLVVNLHAGPSSVFLARMSGAEERLIHSYSGHNKWSTVPIDDGPDSRRPSLLRDLWALEHIGVMASGQQTEIFPGKDEKDRGGDFLSRVFPTRRPVLAIHPGGKTQAKRWPVERFSQVAEVTVSRGLANVIVIVGKGEEDLARRMQGTMLSRTVVARGLSLRQVMGLLSGVSLFLGNDSGLLHIAAALRLKTIALFGPTSAWEWHPYRERDGHVVIQREVSCRGDWCGKERCDDLVCMEGIEPTEVLKKVEQLLCS